MSRSRRKTPIRGNGGHSEAWDKQHWHGRLRARIRRQMDAIVEGKVEPDDHIDAHFRDVSNRWSMAKDGKGYWGAPYCAYWRYVEAPRISYRWFSASHHDMDVRDCPINDRGVCDCVARWEEMMRK